MQPRTQFLIVFGLALSIAVCPSSASSQPFSKFLEERVVAHDLIKAAEARREGTAARIRRAQGEWLPHVEAVGSLGRERIEYPDDDESTETRDVQNISARQLVYDFGRANAGIGRAQAGSGRAEAELAAVRQEIMLQGITAYLDVLRHTERLRLSRESERRITEQTGIEETLVTKGAGLASDVLQAKSQLAGARAQRVRVEGQLQIARNRFMAVFGMEPTEQLLASITMGAAPFDRAPANVAEAEAAAFASSFELLVARYNVHMAQEDVSGAVAGYFPVLHLVGEAERLHNDQGIEGTRNELRGMVELSWDIFSGGTTHAAVREARSSLRDHESRLDDLRKRVEERVAQAWQNMLTTRENARLLRDQAFILEEFLELAKRERLLGTRSLLDVLNGEVGHLNALSNAVSAETDRIIAFYTLFYAMGQLDFDLVP